MLEFQLCIRQTWKSDESRIRARALGLNPEQEIKRVSEQKEARKQREKERGEAEQSGEKDIKTGREDTTRRNTAGGTRPAVWTPWRKGGNAHRDKGNGPGAWQDLIEESDGSKRDSGSQKTGGRTRKSSKDDGWRNKGGTKGSRKSKGEKTGGSRGSRDVQMRFDDTDGSRRSSAGAPQWGSRQRRESEDDMRNRIFHSSRREFEKERQRK